MNYRYLMVALALICTFGCSNEQRPQIDEPEPCSGSDCMAPEEPCDETRYGQVCAGGGICAVIDPCGGPVECIDGDCPTVCVPLWGCMEPTPDGSTCSYDQGTCEVSSRCRPARDDCELVDCDPTNSSCAQNCENEPLTCQPILTGESCDTLECRRGEVCEEHNEPACDDDDDQNCQGFITHATCVVDTVPLRTGARMEEIHVAMVKCVRQMFIERSVRVPTIKVHGSANHRA